MRRHGATVAAKNLTELVFRSIYTPATPSFN
jgi:hypothetical protein